MKKIGFIYFFILVISSSAIAGEGIWLPWLLTALNQAEMQRMGMQMTKEDIYSVNQGSLKDAIVSFGGYCTGEVISKEGLLLTNHHCGYSQIQSHSSLENNYLEQGFWAMSRGEELANPGLTATFIVRVQDVSNAVLEGVTADMTTGERQSRIDKNLVKVRESTVVEEYQDIEIKPFYEGNKYFLFVTITYRDVRLVGAPPSSIGKFGADTDNWEWPRHTGDFALFRIYAGPDNLPADYSPDNKPYKPKHHLPISLDGVEEGDFTMVFGFPGRTDEYLPAIAVEQTMDVLNPTRIAIRDKALAIVDRYMREDKEIQIQYASKFARIANYWKKWKGENQGLEAVNALARKRKREADYQAAMESREDWQQKYGHILDDYEQFYLDIEDYALAREYYNEVFVRNVEIFRIANYFNRLVDLYRENGAPGYQNFQPRLAAYLEDFYKDYRPEIDQEVFAALSQMYREGVPIEQARLPLEEVMKLHGADNTNALADKLYANTGIATLEGMQAIFKMDPAEAVAAIEKDPLCSLAQVLKMAHDEYVSGPYNEIDARINELDRLYMKTLFYAFPGRPFYPNANSTLRLTYGQVEGYASFDGTEYDPHTYLSGVMEKYVPGDYEFDVPAKLQKLHKEKDYGPYADDQGRMPVCFIGSNHTTGGNSGSPVIDAYGNLIGLNFDRVWEGTMSDINYDRQYCRNIMVDARYILFIVDRFAGARHLIKEMTLVNPKTAAQLPKTPSEQQPVLENRVEDGNNNNRQVYPQERMEKRKKVLERPSAPSRDD